MKGNLVVITVWLLMISKIVFAADISDNNGSIPIVISDSDGVDIIDIVTDGAIKRLAVNATVAQNLDNQFRPGEFVIRHLTLSSSIELNVNGSSTPQVFTVAPTTDKVFYVSRLILAIEDENMNHTKFGGIAMGLTNGVDLKVTENGTERDLHAIPLKRNAQFWHLAYDVTINSAATDILSMRWSFFKSGTFLKLADATSDKITATINDNLTSINSFQIIVQGFEVDE